MQGSVEVYSWGDFVRFIHEICEIEPDIGSHPILDQVAADLHFGKLQRRNSKGHPITPWQSTDELRQSYLIPAEVDELPIMKSWRLSWVTSITFDPHKDTQLRDGQNSSIPLEVDSSGERTRRDKIAPVIESAQRAVTDPNDVASVWNEMSAHAKEKNYPFLGIAPEGLIHEDQDGTTKIFDKNALRKRLRRAAKKAANGR
jgi:hypothetical protein